MMTSAQVVETSVAVTNMSFLGLPSPGRSHYTIDLLEIERTLSLSERTKFIENVRKWVLVTESSPTHAHSIHSLATSVYDLTLSLPRSECVILLIDDHTFLCYLFLRIWCYIKTTSPS